MFGVGDGVGGCGTVMMFEVCKGVGGDETKGGGVIPCVLFGKLEL